MAVIGPLNFTGGLCLGYDFSTFPQGKNYANVMQACYVKGGYVVGRWSTPKMNTSAIGNGSTSVTGMKIWKDTVNSVLTLVAACTTKIYTCADLSAFYPQYVDATGTIAFTDRTGAYTIGSGVYYTFDSLNNILVGAGNSSNSIAPFKVTAHNANIAALGGSPPNADCVRQVNNFMFLSRNLSATTTQSKVYWSNVNDPETWSVANVLDFNKNDGEPVMALGSIGTDLYIFKQSSIGRLSTVTVTVSGAVTLGPLTTVIRGVGCAGPRALDNLPNGNIVFVGYDGHFYEFDGSTLVDRSKEAYPGPNIYNQANFSSNPFYQGMSACFVENGITVKTVKGSNQVWVLFTLSLFQNGSMIYVYDFSSGAWMDANPQSTTYAFTSFDEVQYLNVYGSANAYPRESSSYVLAGDVVGNINVSGDSVKSYPFYSNNSLVSRVGTIVQLVGNKGDPFVPASLCLELDCPLTTTGSTLATFNILIGFDTYEAATSVYASTATKVPNRIIVPIPFAQDSTGTNIFPRFMSVQINWTGTGSGTTQSVTADIVRIGQLWISDEIMR